MPLLEIQNLTVEFQTASGLFRAVDGVSLTCDRGEILSIVGESGSGKSVSMLALMGLLPWTAKITADRLAFDGQDLISLSPRERRKIIGKDIAMIFQEPMSSLNPCFTVGYQLGEMLRVHMGLNRRERRERSIELLRLVGIPAPEDRLSNYPHQLSGGMSQRVMIAMALACDPKLLIADEPTTALDVTIQAQILDLLVRLQQENGMALVLITHDMGVVAETAHRVQVQYAGQKVEEQPVRDLFADPHHPYTAALLAALPERAEIGERLPSIGGVVPGQHDRPVGCLFAPRCAFATKLCERGVARQDADLGQVLCNYPLIDGVPKDHPFNDGTVDEPGQPVLSHRPVLEGRDLQRFYSVKRGMFKREATVKALNGVSFSLYAGRTLAVVGESGCGKSTLARLVTMIESPTAGELLIDGEPALVGDAALRNQVQIVFQNPYGSLNPRQKVGAILEEPLIINTSSDAGTRRRKVEEMMARVGLRPEHYDRYPHMFSGGQRQRIAIARALMLQPKVLVLDEPVSALDLSIQAQVLNLLMDLQKEMGLAFLFISHGLSVVRHIADDVMVMYLGRPVEVGTADEVFTNPRHPYTAALLSATPMADPEREKMRIRLQGELPSPLKPPTGCHFNPRCWRAENHCRVVEPPLEGTEDHRFACHFPLRSEVGEPA